MWSRVVQRLPDEVMKFAVNAAVDCLHSSSVEEEERPCLSPVPLHPVLAVARDLRQYNARHDGVLQEIVNAVVPCLPP